MVVYQSGLLLMATHSASNPKDLRRLLASVPVEDLIRRHRFVNFADVTHAKVVKPGVKFKVAFDLAGGEQLEIADRWTGESLGKDDGTMFQDLVRNLRYTGPLPEAAAAEAARTWAEDAMVLDAMSNVKVNDVDYDLVILDTGLVFVADPGGFQHGEQRLASLVENNPVFEIVGRNWMVWYEQIVDARIITNVPVAGELELYDGRRLSLKEGKYIQSLTDDTRQVLCAALRSVGATEPT
ncbi:hypothetical protein STSO111631_09235 [Stackebrandtia soli]